MTARPDRVHAPPWSSSRSPRSCRGSTAPCSTPSAGSRRAASAARPATIRAEATEAYSRAWNPGGRAPADEPPRPRREGPAGPQGPAAAATVVVETVERRTDLERTPRLTPAPGLGFPRGCPRRDDHPRSRPDRPGRATRRGRRQRLPRPATACASTRRARTGRPRTSTLLRYAQDVAWRHSEHLGFDRGWYQARGLGWVVRGVELELHEPIPMGHTLRVSTAVVGHRRIWARRLGECRLADGRLAARVTTDWVLLDARNRIVRIPADFGVAFMNPEVRQRDHPRPAARRRPGQRIGLSVRSSDLDPLDHVNNAVYVDWLDEALDAAGWGAGDAPAAHGPARVPRLGRARRRGRGRALRRRRELGRPDPRSDGLELVRARARAQARWRDREVTAARSRRIIAG